MDVCIWTLSPNFEEILWKFSEIMGKYRILDENLWGLKGDWSLITGRGVLGKMTDSKLFAPPTSRQGKIFRTPPLKSGNFLRPPPLQYGKTSRAPLPFCNPPPLPVISDQSLSSQLQHSNFICANKMLWLSTCQE